ncbi:TetR family transcriptional regulator [Streptomyces sp. NPDC102274]|uniref:TetR family transcriptional regulator n=1 Tax=Streptomyces sp. NPDC102274 TaxID=3366151 RepID=UPI003805A806
MMAQYQRARSAEAKQERADALVQAARDLALQSGVRGVTLTGIAERVGLHHSAIRRYFTSHNEVLLRLAAQGWRGWANRVDGALTAHERPGPARIAAVLVETLAEDPLLCDLLANAPTRIEQDVDIDFIREFKREGMTAARRIAAAVARSEPRLTSEAAWDVLTATNCLAAIRWQVSHPPAALAQVYADEPDLAHFATDFVPDTKRLVEATIRGLINDD